MYDYYIVNGLYERRKADEKFFIYMAGSDGN